ncbi:hypothetical protein C8F01DRAFT_1075576 [Mycena amicta]|nr:hypothetical protein C8F01DRAFT_1075576 [Mycena amicta]
MHNHHPARMMRVRRQTSSAASETTSATAVVDSAGASSTSAVNFQVPTVTKTLEVVVAVLCLVIILGVGLCVFRRWKRSKKNSAPSQIIDFTSEKARPYESDSKLDLHASAYILEKPSSVYMPGASAADMNPGWVPQMPQNKNGGVTSSTSTSSKKSKGSKKSLRSSRGWDKTFSKFAPSERSPPPSYMADSGSGSKTATFASKFPLPPSPPHQSSLPPTPPTPPATKKLNPISRQLPLLKPAPSELPPLPLLSPRSASFGAHQSMAFAQIGLSDENADQPRLMNVVNPFTPTMDDELPIQLGETVRLLEEFQDGWALVQRLGRVDAPKGVVPLTCLSERSPVIPAFSPNRRV